VQVWDIFFPPQLSSQPQDVAARRLRMILVADRCGLSDANFAKIKASVVEVRGLAGQTCDPLRARAHKTSACAQAVQEFAEVGDEGDVGVKLTNDPRLGAVYSVEVPVRRSRIALPAGEDDQRLAAGTFEWRDHVDEALIGRPTGPSCSLF